MLVQRVGRQEQPHAQAFAGTIVLEDHRIAEVPGRFGDILFAEDRQRLRCFDAEFGKRLVLHDFGELELQCALAIDDRCAVASEPSQHGTGELGRIAVIARVR